VITVLPSGRVEFRFFRRGVRNVSVVGTFNAWREGQTPMQQLGGGWWRAELDLADGLHQFRYLADGDWFTDFAAHGVEHSKWGINSLLVLGRARAAA
jgi:1,4-alpha-glucan branching enzyme